MAGTIKPTSRTRALTDVAAIEAHAGEAARFLKALANEQRLLVLCALLGGPRSVGEINEGIALSQSALSQHLAVLREAGLVTTRRASQMIHYALTPGPAVRVMQVLYSEFCSPAAARRRSGRAGVAARHGGAAPNGRARTQVPRLD